MQHRLITTADGSHSLYVNELDEHYHSIHGAIAEAIHVFIKAGMHHLRDKGLRKINILEVGFGTGLNTLLTCMEAEKLNVPVNYTTLEAFPLDIELLNQLNYVELLSGTAEDQAKVRDDFQKIHSAKWEEEIVLGNYFTLHKIKNSLQAIQFEKKFDLIYFDAFGPRVQPEMWTEDVFSKIFNSTIPGGALVTYCAKGEVKRTLKKVGYTVETLPGPPRKREMVRGSRNKDHNL